MSKGQWVVAGEPKKSEEWMASAFVQSDGTVFFPAVFLGSEMAAVMCAAHDGEPMVESDGHVYLRSSWLMNQVDGDLAAKLLSWTKRAIAAAKKISAL